MIERSDLSMAQLRKNITSKGGTTQAGIHVLAGLFLLVFYIRKFNTTVDGSI
jgi:pyrroline-5-carboxylate reductase